MTVFDAHVHFWMPARGFDIKPVADSAFYRQDFMPDQLLPVLKKYGVEGVQLVQSAPDFAETCFMADIAASCPVVRGVTGWVDLDESRVDVEALQAVARLDSVRLQLRRHADLAYASRPRVIANMRRLLEAGLRVTLLAEQKHYPALKVALDALPDLPMVINHCGMPGFMTAWTGWSEAIELFSRRKHMFMQFSGIPANFGENWKGPVAVNSMKWVLKCFGYQRLVFASDWPMLLPFCDYGTWFDAAKDFFKNEGLTGHAVEAIFCRNAQLLHTVD